MKKAGIAAILVVAGLAVAGSSISHMRITNALYESEYPSLDWAGDMLGVAWMDGRDGNQELYFRMVDIKGGNMSPARRLTNSANWDYRPQLVWNGSGFGLLWMHERKVKRDLYFACLDTHGNMTCGPYRHIIQQRIEKDTRMARTGSGYGYIYGDYRPGNLEIFYQALSERGQKAGQETQLTNTQGKTDLSELLFTGGDFAMTFLDDSEGTRQAYFMLFDTGGRVKALRRLSDTASNCTPPSLASTGSGFAAAWCQKAGASDQVMFAALDPGGNLIAGPRAVTSDPSQKDWVGIAPAGQGYGLAYYAGDRLHRALTLCSIDTGGNIIKPPQALTPARKAELACPLIKVLEGGPAIVIAWIDLGNNLNSEIFLTLINQ